MLGAIEAANEVGAVTIGIACNVPSKLLDITRIRIAASVGPEVIAGSTRLKAGTAQKMILDTLTTASMIKLGKVYGNLMVDVRVTNEKLLRRARGIVSQVIGVTEAEASHLLEQSNNEVKVAIVVGFLHVTPEEARSIPARANGQLHEIIGS